MSFDIQGNTMSQARKGSGEVCHTYDLNYNTTGAASGILLDTIDASATNPVQIEVSAQVVTAFNAATNNFIDIGTTGTGGEWVGHASITGGTPGYYPASNAVKKFRLTALTPFYASYTQTGSVAATGTLTSNNTNVSDGNTVTIGTTVYTFKTALTTANHDVLIGADADTSLLNLIRAINYTGTPGTNYIGVTFNPDVSAASSVTSHAFAVTARSVGTAGNSIATTKVGATLSWGAATLAGGVNAATTGAAVIIVKEFSENTTPIA